MSKAKNTKKCEHCGGTINVKYSTCPLCGGQQSEISPDVQPECPRCRVSLQTFLSDDEKYEICPRCGGLWLDKDEFYRATRVQYVYKKVDSKREYQKTPLRGPVDYIPCVRCGKLMNRRNFGKISGVIIDRCSRHGVWLDAGELEKIQHFISDGGLDRARDREIQKNRAKIRELATSVEQTAFTQRLIHFWNFKRWLFRGWR